MRSQTTRIGGGEKIPRSLFRSALMSVKTLSAFAAAEWSAVFALETSDRDAVDVAAVDVAAVAEEEEEEEGSIGGGKWGLWIKGEGTG